MENNNDNRPNIQHPNFNECRSTLCDETKTFALHSLEMPRTQASKHNNNQKFCVYMKDVEDVSNSIKSVT